MSKPSNIDEIFREYDEMKDPSLKLDPEVEKSQLYDDFTNKMRQKSQRLADRDKEIKPLMSLQMKAFLGLTLIIILVVSGVFAPTYIPSLDFQADNDGNFNPNANRDRPNMAEMFADMDCEEFLEMLAKKGINYDDMPEERKSRLPEHLQSC